MIHPNQIRVGITEWHGVAHELAQFPPEGVSYSPIAAEKSRRIRLVRSQIKGYLRTFEAKDHDLIEAILSPIRTRSPWVYSIANFQEATAFSFLGVPLPRAARVAYLERLLTAKNFRKLIFWSVAGQKSLRDYGFVTNPEIVAKTTVVYPAIRRVPDSKLRRYTDSPLQLLFGGDFFRKGGAHVVDAFQRARKSHSHIMLRLCCDPDLDFNTKNPELRNRYLRRIRETPNIIIGRVSRAEMIEQILPATDIYLLPTYIEAFGYAILEAMAFGIPTIATNYFAIPELIGDQEDGLLIDTKPFSCERMFAGYRVDSIPASFHEYMTEGVYTRLKVLIESPERRASIGRSALNSARGRFSFTERNRRMSAIYSDALYTTGR